MDDTGKLLIECVGVMVKEFQEKLRELETYAMLLSNPQLFEQDLERGLRDLERIESTIEEFTRIVDRESSTIQKAKLLCDRLNKTRERMSHLDKFLSKLQKQQQPMVGNNQFSESVPAFYQQSSTGFDVSEVPEDDSTIILIQKAKEKDGGGVLQITVPTKQDFDKVPRYKKGMLTYEEFKALCGVINSAAERKRVILEAPVEKLGPNAKTMYTVWKNQKCDDLGSLTFVTDEDILTELEQNQNIKPNMVQSGWECLRHLLIIRVSEVPERKLRRYVFLK